MAPIHRTGPGTLNEGQSMSSFPRKWTSGHSCSRSAGFSPDLKVIKKTGGDHETRFAMTSKSWVSRLGAPLTALILTVAPLGSTVHAVEGARKVSVVSFGLFGDQGVFRREATGAAQIVARRFRSGPINVQ